MIDLTKQYAHKITDKVALTFEFNASYLLLGNHFILGEISFILFYCISEICD